ncbi:DNase I-like protein [Gonapodya prolifera JEL478]|uniref:DNA-(apurinic or apyrimidinic site) endonuclease n=1 Tax=Gonapodya prolifera (strain JEL478) TaxID=1344416 RepID=A0A139ACF6_GONPJ|nr:DNase I-like protein [Gonapodya prolifera JEL478]|eukprot:KXS14349.1 DNase I-like protein [Gonapodya prolifera JEL478]
MIDEGGHNQARRTRKLNILSWNCNGLATLEKKHTQQTKDPIKALRALFDEFQADVILFQETKVAPPPRLPKTLARVCGYDSFFAFSDPGKRGWGVAAYVRKGLVKSVTPGFFRPPRDNEEARSLSLDFGTYELLCLYVPNPYKSQDRLDYKTAWCEDLESRVKELFRKGKPIIIAGDLNTAITPIDHYNPVKHSQERGFTAPERKFWTDLMESYDLCDVWREREGKGKANVFTWWEVKKNMRAHNYGWRVDYFLISRSLMPYVSSSSILTEVTGSDHCPITLSLDLPDNGLVKFQRFSGRVAGAMNRNMEVVSDTSSDDSTDEEQDVDVSMQIGKVPLALSTPKSTLRDPVSDSPSTPLKDPPTLRPSVSPSLPGVEPSSKKEVQGNYRPLPGVRTGTGTPQGQADAAARHRVAMVLLADSTLSLETEQGRREVMKRSGVTEDALPGAAKRIETVAVGRDRAMQSSLKGSADVSDRVGAGRSTSSSRNDGRSLNTLTESQSAPVVAISSDDERYSVGSVSNSGRKRSASSDPSSESKRQRLMRS